MKSSYCTICAGSDKGGHEGEKCSYCQGTGSEQSKQSVDDEAMYEAMQDDYNELYQVGEK